jgi:ribonuclease HII
VKDSKKFTSEKKRAEAAAYIKANSCWSVSYMDEGMIDQINILQATLRCMHTSIHELLDQVGEKDIELLIDGNCFKPLFRLENESMVQVPHTCIEKGDALYPCISAASILAKVARDEYVIQMCDTHPELDKYGLRKNKGYGTKAHRDGIKHHGLTEWHRKRFVLKSEPE